MNFKLFGNICGDSCKDCSHPLQYAIVRLYRAELTQETLTHVVATPKDTLRELKQEELNRLKPYFLASGQVNAKGDYAVELSRDKQDYQGGPVLIVVEIPYLHPMKGPEEKRPTLYYAITTLQPEWQYTRDQATAIARFDYCFPERIFCAILKYFDVWVICGRIVDCDTKKKGISGLQVTAMDADLISDDTLGTAFTNNDGEFRIYYRSADFKRTFLSPWINIETLGSAGPDVYFTVRSETGTMLIEETRADGKARGRKDIGNCFCIQLCVDVTPIPPVRVAVWNGVGSAFLISTEGNPQDFDNDGYAMAGGADYAIHGAPTMTGDKHDPINPAQENQVYRFLVSTTTASNSAPAVTTGFSPVGLGSPALAVENLHVGNIFRWVYNAITDSFNQFTVQVRLKASEDVTVDGWVNVRNAVNRALNNTAGHSAAELTVPGHGWMWEDKDVMFRINTGAFTAHGSRPNFGGLNAGDAIPAGSQYGIEKIAIRFEIRDNVTMAPVPGNGTTLNAMVINNDAVVVRLAAKHVGGSAIVCDKFHDEDVQLAYTLYHPHLGSGQLYIYNTGTGTEVFRYLPLAGDTTYFLNTPALPGTVHSNNPSIIVPKTSFVTCTYKTVLAYHVRLHSGDSPVPGTHAEVIFYYEE